MIGSGSKTLTLQGGGFIPKSLDFDSSRTPLAMNWRLFTPEGQLLWPSAWRSLAVAWILIWSPCFTFEFSGGSQIILRTGGSRSTLLYVPSTLPSSGPSALIG